jgi:preprotein translocase subunit SecD
MACVNESSVDLRTGLGVGAVGLCLVLVFLFRYYGTATNLTASFAAINIPLVSYPILQLVEAISKALGGVSISVPAETT